MEALEARIREMEERLRSSRPTVDGGNTLDQRLAAAVGSGGSPRSQRAPVANVFDQPQSSEPADDVPPPLPQKDYARRGVQDPRQQHGRSRPGTAKESHQAMGGELPPTPVASEGEYELVTNRSTSPATISSSTITASACSVDVADFVLVAAAQDGDGEQDSN